MEEYKKIAAERYRARMAAAALAQQPVSSVGHSAGHRSHRTSHSSHTSYTRARTSASRPRPYSRPYTTHTSAHAVSSSGSGRRPVANTSSSAHSSRRSVHRPPSTHRRVHHDAAGMENTEDMEYDDAPDAMVQQMLTEMGRHMALFSPFVSSRHLPLFSGALLIEEDDGFLMDLPEEQRQGATEQQINALPVGTMATLPNAIGCSVCLDDIAPGAKITTLPCAHVYHQDCIGKWLAVKKECPKCKTSIDASVNTEDVSAAVVPDVAAAPVA